MKRPLVLAGLLAAAPAWADDQDRDYCPARPGLGSPACTMSSGRVSVETSLADWTLDKQPGERTDTILIGDTQVRIGLNDTIEAQIGWTPAGFVRDRTGGIVDRLARTGDVTLGLKANFAHPDGKGFSIAAQPFVTLPTGRPPIGAGDWGAGLAVPITYDLSDTINLEVTPEIDAAVDQVGHGRHIAARTVIGLGFALNDKLTLTLEGQALRDDDPSGKTTQGLASASFAYMATKDLQFDLGSVVGLTHDAPNIEFYAGIAKRF